MSGASAAVHDPDGWQQWLAGLRADCDRLDQFLPPNLFSLEGAPPWVRKVEAKVTQALFPTVKIKPDSLPTPALAGALLGHQHALMIWMVEVFTAIAPRLEQELPALKLTAEQTAQAEAFARPIFEQWLPGVHDLANQALQTSAGQSYPDMAAFRLAYATALACKPQAPNLEAIGQTSFQIHFFLLIHWRAIVRLNSVAELHAGLVQRFGKNRAGDSKRIAKLCQRLGLRFRKPGRPRKPAK